MHREHVRTHRLGAAGDLVRRLPLRAQRDEEPADLRRRRLSAHDLAHHLAGVVAPEVMPVEQRVDRGLDHRVRVCLTASTSRSRSASSLYGPIGHSRERRALPLVHGELDPVLVVEPAVPELLRIRFFTVNARMSGERSPRRGLSPSCREPPLGLVGERVAASRSIVAVHVDRRRHGEVGRRVVRPLPAVALAEVGVLVVAPADHERLDPVLVLRAAPTGSPIPSARTATCGSCPRTRRRRWPRGRAGRGPARVRRRRSRGRLPSARLADLLDGEHERGGRRDVGDDDRPRADPDVRDQLLGLDEDDVRPDEPERPQDRAVLVLRGEDLLLGPDPQRADDRVQRRGRVRREHEVVGRPRRRTRRAPFAHPHRLLEPPSEELGRLALELSLQPLVLVEHLHGARAVAAVVEVRDLRVEEKPLAHARLVSHGAKGTGVRCGWSGRATGLESRTWL